MTHPLQKPTAHTTKFQQVKPGEPFDPEELCRRLQMHIVTQRIRAEQRRSARVVNVTAELGAEKPASGISLAPKKDPIGQEAIYHHVPKVAASAFARTATPDPMRKVHKLSEPVVRAHMERLALEESAGGVKTVKETQARDQTLLAKEMLKNRNQFQRTQDMENAAEVDIYREVYKPPQRTFMGEFSHLLPGHHDKKTQRPLSMGDVLEDDDALTLTRTKRKSKPPGFDMSERNNWAQQDEPDIKSPKKETSVRRKPSSWILLGRRSPKLDKEKDEAVAGVGEASPPDGSKSAKLGFLARFKRHPG